MNIYSIIKNFLTTKKNDYLSKENKMVFEVNIKANKYMIKQAFKEIYNLSVNVRTVIIRGKPKKMGKYIGKRKNIKKAFIFFKDKIDKSIFGINEKKIS